MLRAFVILVAVHAALSAVACSRAHTENPPTGRETFRVKGVVTAIDPAAPRISVDHEEIVGYMPAMEMSIDVADASLIAGLKTGDKVEFDLERDNNRLTITSLDKTGEAAADGASIYASSCAVCHGAGGEGARLGIPLTRGHALHHTRDEHLRQVADGEGDKMPAFRDKLTDREIAAVVDFVRGTLQKDLRRDASSKHEH